MGSGRTLVVFGGHPLSRRAQLAGAVADALRAPCVGFERLARSAGSCRRFAAFLERTRATLAAHELVVAVGPLWRKHQRAELRELAEATEAHLVFFECTCSIEGMQQHLRHQYASAAP